MNESKVSKKEVEPKSKVRVLVVEDDLELLPLLKIAVDGVGGLEFLTTNSKTEALKILKESKEKGQAIDIVSSDLGLIDSSDGGLKIARAIKSEGLAKYFILFTASAQKFDGINPEQLKDEGIDLLVGKPATFSVIKDFLSNAKMTVKSSQTAR